MRRRTAVLLGVVAALVAAGGVYTWHRVATGGEVTEVGVAEAIDRYRERIDTTTIGPPATTASRTTEVPAATTTTAAVVHSLVEPGVYQYATSGFDSVDALTGARHDYPEVTTMTVVPHGCGVRLRWDVAEERWDSWDWCLDDGGIRQTAFVGYHEFFGTAGRNDYTCEGDRRPLDAPAGTTWTSTCRMDDRTTSSFTCRVVERATLTVTGTEIPVLHVRCDVDVAGESTGHQTVETWYRITDGLVVREQLMIATKQDTVIGVTNFEERYTIELLTPTPAS